MKKKKWKLNPLLCIFLTKKKLAVKQARPRLHFSLKRLQWKRGRIVTCYWRWLIVEVKITLPAVEFEKCLLKAVVRYSLYMLCGPQVFCSSGPWKMPVRLHHGFFWQNNLYTYRQHVNHYGMLKRVCSCHYETGLRKLRSFSRSQTSSGTKTVSGCHLPHILLQRGAFHTNCLRISNTEMQRL